MANDQEYRNDEPKGPPDAKRRTVRYIVIAIIAALLLLPFIAGAVVANFYPKTWKDYTSRNCFPVLHPGKQFRRITPPETASRCFWRTARAG